METVSLYKRTNYRKFWTEAVCYAYVLVFMYAAVYKLIDFAFFQSQLRHSPLLGSFAIAFSYLVPFSEL